MPLQGRMPPHHRRDLPPAADPAQPDLAARHDFHRLVYAAILTRQHDGIEAAALLEQAHWSSSEPVGNRLHKFKIGAGTPPCSSHGAGSVPARKVSEITTGQKRFATRPLVASILTVVTPAGTANDGVG